MLTQYDKALAPLLIWVIGLLNQKFGWQFSTDPTTVAAVLGALSVLATYFIPNRKATA